MPESSTVMVQVSVGGSRQLQSAEADFVQRLVTQQRALVRVLDELVGSWGLRRMAPPPRWTPWATK